MATRRVSVMQNAIQIGIFGDSISKGIVLDEETHRYSTLKKEISQWVTPAAALHNFSVMGSTIQKGLSIIKRHTEQLSGYQNVFLEFGGNDCDFDWQAVSERPQAHHEPHTPLKQFETLYTKAIQLIQEKKGNPILLTLPPLEPKAILSMDFSQLTRQQYFALAGQRRYHLSLAGDVQHESAVVGTKTTCTGCRHPQCLSGTA